MSTAVDTYQDMPKHIADGFAVYTTNAQRSLRKTADLLGIPQGTVRAWSWRYQWNSRIKDEDDEDRRAAVTAAASVATRHHLRNIEVAAAIRDDPKAPAVARLKAVEWLSAIGGLLPVQKLDIDAITDSGQSATVALSDLLSLATAGNVAALVAIAQGRTPPALPAAADPDPD